MGTVLLPCQAVVEETHKDNVQLSLPAPAVECVQVEQHLEFASLTLLRLLLLDEYIGQNNASTKGCCNLR